VVLLLVGEPVVGDRAVARLVRAALERDRTTAVTRIDAEEYGAGTLRTLAGPSLFGEPRAIVASRLHKMNDAFLADALEYVAAPEEDVVLIARHDGGTRGRRLLDAIAEAGYQRCEIPAVKTDADKAELVRSDVAGAGRTMTRPAVEALVDALGRDVGELLAATSQLLADVDGNSLADPEMLGADSQLERPHRLTLLPQVGGAHRVARHFARRVLRHIDHGVDVLTDHLPPGLQHRHAEGFEGLDELQQIVDVILDTAQAVRVRLRRWRQGRGRGLLDRGFLFHLPSATEKRHVSTIGQWISHMRRARCEKPSPRDAGRWTRPAGGNSTHPASKRFWASYRIPG